MSGVKLGGRESDLTIPECGLATQQPYTCCILVTTSCEEQCGYKKLLNKTTSKNKKGNIKEQGVHV